jgi:IS605 OrfB family transposase
MDATLQAFASACDFAADVARRIGSTNKVKVQAEGYRDIRERFGLSANLAIRAIARACAALKVPEKMHSTFDPTSIDYDARIFAFQEWNWTFGLTLLGGRRKIHTRLGDHQRALLKGSKPTSATLVKRHDGVFFLHVQIKEEAPPEIKVRGHIGVDLGVKNLAATDDGETFSGDDVENSRRRYRNRRKGLNTCGTKNARRRLRKIRKREANFRKDVNHRISNKIVAKAKDTGCGIGLEDLQGIRDRTTAQKADERSRRHGWAFYQLQTFIGYKAAREGIPVIKVDPADTSKTCSACGHCESGNRKTRDHFVCRRCAFECCADINAVRNIKLRAQVMAPMAGAVDPGLETRRGCLQAYRQAAPL